MNRAATILLWDSMSQCVGIFDMDYSTLHDRVVRRLDLLIGKLGPGARTQLLDSIEVGSTFFTDLRRQKARLPMDKLAQLLELLGEPPAEFFYEALREPGMPDLPVSGESALRKLPKTADPEVDEQVARILRIVDERMRGEEL